MTSHANFGSYSLEDIQAIFDLSEQDLTKKILVYGAGASYLAHPNITLVDPLYQHDLSEIKQLTAAKYQELEKTFKQNPAYVWEYYSSPTAALEAYQKNSGAFLEHYSQEKKAQRYISGNLENLPFPDNAFDLLLCLDSFFATSQHLESHLDMVKELQRIASDIRVFPLLDKSGQLFTNIGQFIFDLQQQGFGIELKHSDFVLQDQGDAVLKIWPQTCTL